MDQTLHQQRIDLACALRWAARLGLHEGVCNHFSLAVADADGLVRLVHSPALVDGIAASDLLELDPSALCGFRVIMRGGRVAVVFVLPSAEVRAQAQSDLSKQIRTLGGLCDGGPQLTLVFSVPVTAGFPAIERFFTDARARFPGSEWWFGNVYDADGKPLEWW